MKRIFLALVLSCFLIPSAFAGFNDQGGGIVWDDSTGLMWQQGHASTIGDTNDSFKWGGGTVATSDCDGTADPDGISGNEEDALCYCDNLGLGSYTDWRLPDRNEMHSTFDYANSPVALDDLFLGLSAAHHVFWASTSINPTLIPPVDAIRAWGAGPIGQGKLSQANRKTETYHVRCVRGRVFQVTATAGPNLTIDLPGENWVDYEGDLDVTYTAEGGFTITDVTVDGTSIGPKVTPYTHSFTNVVGNHTIHATTALNTYDIAVTVGDNGTVTDVDNSVVINPPGDTVIVDHNATPTFEATPATHYHIDQVQYDGGDVSNPYTTPPITADHTFSATFAEDDKFELAVTTDGTGTGAVTSDDAIIDCPDNTCSHEYYFDHPTPIVLTATVAADSVFAGWSGDCSPTTDTTCTLDDMSQARSVTATFDSSTPKKMSILLLIQGMLSALQSP